MKILIAEDDEVSRRILATTLKNWGHEVVAAKDGIEAWSVLKEEDAPSLAIMDWMMPGIEGPEVCRRARRKITTSPIYLILLTALSRKEDLVEGLEAGADDYLTKPYDRDELRVRLQVGMRIVELQSSLSQHVRQLEVAIEERKRAEEALRDLTLTDDLTGLYNRRGLFTLAEYHAKSSRRMGQNSALFYADIDGLKQINDTFGHNEGSLAIAKVADILRQTFRESDVIARVGGDEFVVLAQNVAGAEMGSSAARLQENLRIYNAQANHPYQLSLSVGVVCIDADSIPSFDQLLAQADKIMYANKRNKNAHFSINMSPSPSKWRSTYEDRFSS